MDVNAIIEYLKQQQEIQAKLLELLQSQTQLKVAKNDEEFGTGFIDPALLGQSDRVHINIAQDEVIYSDGSKVTSCWFYWDDKNEKRPLLVDAINGYIEDVCVKYSSDLVDKVEGVRDPYRIHIYLRLDESKLLPEGFPDVQTVVLNAGATSHFAKQCLVALQNFNKGDRVYVSVYPGTRKVVHVHVYDGNRRQIRVSWNDVKEEFGGKQWNKQWEALEAKIVKRFDGVNDRAGGSDSLTESADVEVAKTVLKNPSKPQVKPQVKPPSQGKPHLPKASEQTQPLNFDHVDIINDLKAGFGIDTKSLTNVVEVIAGQVIGVERLTNFQFGSLVKQLMVCRAISKGKIASSREVELFYNGFLKREALSEVGFGGKLVSQWHEYLKSLPSTVSDKESDYYSQQEDFYELNPDTSSLTMTNY